MLNKEEDVAHKKLTPEKQIAILVDALTTTAGRISWHHPSCRGGDFATCRCMNAVTVRRIQAALARTGHPIE